ncbi:hypothetical protein [Pseudofrankia sp. DC12]|uniref:hypothetical protein n=1 Tax=Pseudofrankia sp. DC12 TaxID=683315 RepID=UPI0006974EFD|nr:hypothetical protein [Pseudofrankia sp. DC12]
MTSSGAASTPSASPADPAAEVRAAVTLAEKRYFDAYRAAGADPSDSALVTALRSLYTDQSVVGDNVRGRMAFFAQHGYVVRPDPASYYVIESITVNALPPTGRAVSVDCGWDTDPVIDGVHRAPDGREITVNNTPGGGRTRTTWLEQADGSWKIGDALVLDSWEGVNRCPARPGGS